MMKMFVTVATIIALATAIGCAKKEHAGHEGAAAQEASKAADKPAEKAAEKAADNPADKAAEKPAAEAADKPAEKAAAPAADKVAVTAAGTNFDPAVAKDKIPAGAWYCDMGTVHFARSGQGDGKCPRCGMKLHEMAAK